MKILNVARLNEMIQINLDIKDLIDFGIADDEIIVYLEELADSLINDDIIKKGQYDN